MLVIRKEQLATLKDEGLRAMVPKLVPEIINRLQEVEILAQSIEKDEHLIQTTASDIIRALQYNISSMNGLLQFCSYRYTISENWFENEAVARILAKQTVKERERMIEIEKLFATYK